MTKINNLIISLKRFLSVLVVVGAFSVIVMPLSVSAAPSQGEIDDLRRTCIENKGTFNEDTLQCENENEGSNSNARQEIKSDCSAAELNESNCQIIKYTLDAINILSALVGVIAVFSLIWAGYQYMMARDNSQSVSAAKSRIITTILALILYMFMWTLLQWLVPGGIL